MSQEVLLLNADAQPISFLPLSSISWQDGISLLCTDKAETLHSYDGWFVHSPSVTMQVPSVMILRKQVHKLRHWMARDNGNPQKPLVFLRDMYVCQYCTTQYPRRQLTIDHVVPRVHGGRTRWDNVTTACAACNAGRGCDMRIVPKVKPWRPTYGQLLKNMRAFPIAIPHKSWNWFLGWDESKVHLIAPRSGHTQHNGFDFGSRFALESHNI